jgi:hypothetical protein
MARTGELNSTVGIAVLEALVELEDGKGIELEGSSVDFIAVVELETEDAMLAVRVIQQTFMYSHPWGYQAVAQSASGGVAQSLTSYSMLKRVCPSSTHDG